MQEFGFFVGRFHVLLLHLPIGILIAAVVLDWLARRPRYAPLASAAPLLWALAAISAVLTAILGYLHFAEGSFTGPSAEAHRLWGTITAIAAVEGWWLARRGGRAGAIRLAAGLVLLVLVSITGHHGGNLTHGTTFLSEYAPSFLRGLIGAAPRRPPVTSVAAADPYLDVVQPLLEQRCGTCHGSDKREGSFSMASYDSLLAGGDTGRAVVPGNLEASELIYRTGLPPDDEAFMPAEGKTPLTAAQVEILRWWVGAGAPRDTTIGAVGAPANVEPLLAAQLGLGARRQPQRLRAPSPQIRSSSPACSRRASCCAPGIAERRAARRQRELARHGIERAGTGGATSRRDRNRRPEFRRHGARRCRARRDRRLARRDAPAPRPQCAHGREPCGARRGAAAHASEPVRQQPHHGPRDRRTRRYRDVARGLSVADRGVGQRAARLREARPALVVDIGSRAARRVEPL